jgi:chromosomal replication initiator protein
LIIDDIQFVETYPKTKEELIHTFNALYQANKQIVLASDRAPKDIKNITDRLRTRFEGGMVSDIHLQCLRQD